MTESQCTLRFVKNRAKRLKKKIMNKDDDLASITETTVTPAKIERSVYLTTANDSLRNSKIKNLLKKKRILLVYQQKRDDLFYHGGDICHKHTPQNDKNIHRNVQGPQSSDHQLSLGTPT